MCAHYENVPAPDWFPDFFGATLPESPGKLDLWPGYLGSFVRLAPGLIEPEPDDRFNAPPRRETVNGVFGLLPHWAADERLARSTYNARSETVSSKPSFRDAWRKARHCVIPARAIYEPDWRSGKAISTRIERADGRPMGIAGLWDAWQKPDGSWLLSYTMLTINADEHPLMRDFHKPAEEKRMVVILPESSYEAWLSAPANASAVYLNPFPAADLVASPQLVSSRSG